jgi:hypothetical protein
MSRSLGSPTFGCTSPVAPPTHDAHRAVGDEVDLSAVGGDLGDPADEPFAVDDGVVDLHAVGGAGVDVDRRVPDVGRFEDHRGGHGVVVADAETVEVIERGELAV